MWKPQQILVSVIPGREILPMETVTCCFGFDRRDKMKCFNSFLLWNLKKGMKSNKLSAGNYSSVSLKIQHSLLLKRLTRQSLRGVGKSLWKRRKLKDQDQSQTHGTDVLTKSMFLGYNSKFYIQSYWPLNDNFNSFSLSILFPQIFQSTFFFKFYNKYKALKIASGINF